MRKSNARIQLVAVAIAAGIALPVTSAHAENYTVQISARVPVRCEANLVGGLAEVTPGTYQLGSVRQFCNSPFKMTVIHDPLAAGSSFAFKGSSVPADGSETVLAASSRAADEQAPIYVSGIDQTAATQLASSLVLSLTPLGV